MCPDGMFPASPPPPSNRTIHRRMRELKAEIAREFSVQIQVRTDFGEFRRLANAIPDKCELTAIFDDRVSDIGPENGFWIEGHDDAGRIMHMQSFRYDDLGACSLNGHWQANSKLYQPAGMDIDTSKSVFKTAPASYEICGKVCYHAEFWIAKDNRRLGLARRLSAFGMLFALTRFTPDYIYGFIPIKHIQRGLSVQYGYLHFHPWAPRWHIVGEKHPYDEYLIWVRGDELRSLWTADERTIDVGRRADNSNDPGFSVVKLEAG